MRAAIAVFVAVGCLLLAGVLGDGGPVPQEQIDALVDFYHAMDGPNWRFNKNWLVGDPCENDWDGVECCGILYRGYLCEDSGTNVTVLALKSNHLSGTIPESFSALPLKELDLYTNYINGTIEDALAPLADISSLLYLDLGGNQLYGTIPDFIFTSSPDLEFLDLSFNALSGTISNKIGQLEGLNYLNLYSNQLSGTLPQGLGNLKELASLGLWGNQLTGTIPEIFCGMSKLQELYIEENLFYGAVPNSLSGCCVPQLVFLFLDDNYLSSFPTSLQEDIPNFWEEISALTNCWRPPIPDWCAEDSQNPNCSQRPREECHAFYCGLLPTLSKRQAEQIGTTWNCQNYTSAAGPF